MQGIATLPYEVYELPMVPEGGIQQYEQAADMLAEFGRNGDTYIVHAAEGETMVPMEVLDNNPRLKKMLFSQMEEMGIEPDRYIVGNELNSINPVTGQPEFFLRKVFRKISRGAKKIGKKFAEIGDNKRKLARQNSKNKKKKKKKKKMEERVNLAMTMPSPKSRRY